MASGTADLQRDLGGAFMQSIFGALLTAGYAAAVASALAGDPNADQITSSVQAQLTKSFSSAEAVAQQYPQYATAITAGRQDVVPRRAPTGPTWRASIAVLLGAALVFFMFPRKTDEERLLAEYHAEDTGAAQQRRPTPATPSTQPA